MTIQEIVVYPIKSLRGVSLQSTEVEARGLRHDRRWMLVDAAGLFLTQRKLHKMALIDTTIDGAGLTVSLEGCGSVAVPFQAEGEARTVQVWNDVCEAIDAGEEPADWFSDALGCSCRLVYMPDHSIRPLKAPGAHDGDAIAFSDGNPILFASQASIDDLNSRLESPIPIRRFRPNVVLNGCGPYDEDHWGGVAIGDVRLRKTMQSGRCLVTTIDIETAATSDEPLRTLATYRKEGNHVWFGCYYAPDRLGRISVGDVFCPLG